MNRLQNSRKLISTMAPGIVWLIPVLCSMSECGGWKDYISPCRQGYSLIAWRKWRSPTMAIFFNFWAKTSMRTGEVASILADLVAKVFLTLSPFCVAIAICPWLYYDMMGEWLFMVCICLPNSVIPRKTQDLVLLMSSGLYFVLGWMLFTHLFN